MSADPRVTGARAYVDQAKPRNDVLLPASVLTRMFYELRRHTIDLLAVIDEHQAATRITAGQRGVLGLVLADAAEYRANHADASDRAKADAYLTLARQLGIEVDR